MARRRRSFGKLRKLPSGRFQASYVGADGQRHTAPSTFDTRTDANAWLALRQSEILRHEWQPPVEHEKVAAVLTFGQYAETWLGGRELKPRTRAHYRTLLDDHVLPRFGGSPIAEVDPPAVRAWYATVAAGRPTLKAHAYGLLRTICATAVADDLIVANPCRVRGGGQSKRVKQIRPATLDELTVIVRTIPSRYRAMVLLAAWCALRFGELTELRRSDVDMKAGVLRVRRGVARADGEVIVGDPKSEAGKRDVAIPPHLMPALKTHLREHVAASQKALVFPAANGTDHMAPATLYRVYYRAREAAGRPDLRFHDLRHTGATLAAATGATLAELMARLGHSTPGAAMRYQHAAADRDRVIAEALSKLAESVEVVHLDDRRTA